MRGAKTTKKTQNAIDKSAWQPSHLISSLIFCSASFFFQVTIENYTHVSYYESMAVHCVAKYSSFLASPVVKDETKSNQTASNTEQDMECMKRFTLSVSFFSFFCLILSLHLFLCVAQSDKRPRDLSYFIGNSAHSFFFTRSRILLENSVRALATGTVVSFPIPAANGMECLFLSSAIKILLQIVIVKR